jgi:linearmycin/streptolysin S transport system permease protein
VIGAAIKKDVWLLLRDRGALISLFALPIIFIVAFGSMFRGGGGADDKSAKSIPIFYEQGDADGEAIAKVLADSPGFKADRRSSAEEVRSIVHDEKAQAGLVVPKDGPVELVIDLATPLQVRAPIQGALNGIAMRALAPKTCMGPPRAVEPKSPPGVAKPLDNITAFQITVPGNAVLFGFFIALTVAMAFTGEKKTGTWRRLLAAPVPRWQALLATLVPYYLVGLCQLAFLFGIGATVFGMKVAGSVAALVVLSMSVSLCAVCLGFLFAAIGGSERQLGGVGSVVLLVMGLLGGCMFPRLIMPPFMKQLGLGVPHGWALDGYYDVLVREGTSIADIAPSIAALLAFAVAFAGLGLALFRFER